MDLVGQLGSRFKSELTGQVIATISGAMLTVILARLLAPSGYGLFFLAMSVFSVARIFSKLGLAQSAARYISEYVKKDPGQIYYLLRYSFLFNIVSIIIVVLVLGLGSVYIAILIGEPKLTPLLKLGTLFIVFATLTSYTRIISQGFEDIKLAAIIHSINRSSRLLFSVGLILLGYGVTGALGGYIMGSLLASSLGLVAIYNRYYDEVSNSDYMEKGLIRRLIEYNIPLTITDMSLKLDQQVDTILVGFFLNPISVGYYVLSKQIVTFVQVPAASLGFSISPTYGKQKAANELTTTAKIFEKSLSHILLLYVPIALGIYLLAEPAITLVFGSSYEGSVPILQVLSIYTVLLAMSHLTDRPLDYLGRAKIRSIAQGFSSLTNLLLNLLLIPMIGVVGAAIATIFTHAIYTFVKLCVVSSELPLDYKTIFIDMVRMGIVTIGMGSLIWVLLGYVNGIISLIVVSFVGSLSWLILAFSTGALDTGIVSKIV